MRKKKERGSEEEERGKIERKNRKKKGKGRLCRLKKILIYIRPKFTQNLIELIQLHSCVIKSKKEL